MWTELFSKAAPYLLKAAGIIIIVVAIYNYGRSAERAVWEPKLAEANLQRAKLETELATKQTIAQQITTQSRIDYANTISDLVQRNADYSRSFRDLSLRIAKLLAERNSLSALPATTGGTHDTATLEERPDELAARADSAATKFDTTGHNCELDAAQLEALQRWLIQQELLWSATPALP